MPCFFDEAGIGCNRRTPTSRRKQKVFQTERRITKRKERAEVRKVAIVAVGKK
jgi:hypothetical protein